MRAVTWVGRSLAYSLPATIVALAWLRLEEPRAGGGDGLWIVLLALVPALLPTLAARLVAVPRRCARRDVDRLRLARPGRRPERGGFFAPAYDSFVDGIARLLRRSRAVLRRRVAGRCTACSCSPIFGFCVVLGLVVASRRPLPAVLRCWRAPAGRRRSADRGIVFGTLILTAALWLLAALRVARPTPALAAGGSSWSPRRSGSRARLRSPRTASLAWERWDPYRRAGTRPRRLRLGRELRRDRLPGQADDRAPDPRARAEPLLARDDARPVHRGPLDREPRSDRARRAGRPACRATRSCRRAAYERRAGRSRRSRSSALADDHLVAATAPIVLRGGRARARPPPRRGDRAASGRAPARPALHRLQLHAAAEAGRAGALPCELSGEPRALPRPRPHARAAVRHPRPRARRSRRSSRTNASSRSGTTRGCTARRSGSPTGATRAVRRRRRDRDVAANDRRLRLRRAAAGAAAGRTAARALRRERAPRLLPAVRGLDGADAPLPRDPGPRRRRLHEREVPRRRLDGHRSQRARLGRGLVPALRLALVRPDARARRARRRLQLLVADLQPGRRRRDRVRRRPRRARPRPGRGRRARPARRVARAPGASDGSVSPPGGINSLWILLALAAARSQRSGSGSSRGAALAI